MKTYKEYKAWYEEHKMVFILGACFVLVFLSGFGIGRYDKARNSKAKIPANYSNNKATPQKAVAGAVTTNPAEAVEAKAPAPAPAPVPAATQECKIKGNISSGSKKIYHMPGGASYKIVKPEMCFNTEDEARAAGFVKAGR